MPIHEIHSSEDHAHWKMPEQIDQESSVVGIENIKAKLEEVYQNNYLITHQTWADSAQRISQGETFQGFLKGTAADASPESIAQVLPELDKTGPRTFGITHKGANAAVIMTFPRELLGEQSNDDQGMIITLIDDFNSELYNQRLVSEHGLPNRLILGYYTNSALHLNINFDPSIPEQWRAIQIEKDNDQLTDSPIIQPENIDVLPAPPEAIDLNVSTQNQESAVDDSQLPPPPENHSLVP